MARRRARTSSPSEQDGQGRLPAAWAGDGPVSRVEPGHSGKLAVKLGTGARVFQCLALEDGFAYHGSVWARGSGKLVIDFYEYGDGPGIGYAGGVNSGALDLSSQWQQFHLTYSKGPNEKPLKGLAYALSCGGKDKEAEILIDDASIGKLPIPAALPNLLSNPTFNDTDSNGLPRGWKGEKRRLQVEAGPSGLRAVRCAATLFSEDYLPGPGFRDWWSWARWERRPAEFRQGLPACELAQPASPEKHVASPAMREVHITLANGVSLDMPLDGQRLVGVTAVRCGGKLLRNPQAPPLAPVVQTTPARAYSECLYQGWEEAGGGVVVHSTLRTRDGARDQLDWIFAPANEKLAGRQFAGLRYGYHTVLFLRAATPDFLILQDTFLFPEVSPAATTMKSVLFSAEPGGADDWAKLRDALYARYRRQLGAPPEKPIEPAVWKEHPEFILAGPNGKRAAAYYSPWGWPGKLAAGYAGYTLDRLKSARRRTGLDGLWLDSYSNATHLLDTASFADAVLQADALLPWQAQIEKAGYYTYCEGEPHCLGYQSTSGWRVPEDWSRFRPETFYKQGLYLQQTSTDDMARFLADPHRRYYYRTLANRCCPSSANEASSGRRKPARPSSPSKTWTTLCRRGGSCSMSPKASPSPCPPTGRQCWPATTHTG